MHSNKKFHILRFYANLCHLVWWILALIIFILCYFGNICIGMQKPWRIHHRKTISVLVLSWYTKLELNSSINQRIKFKAFKISGSSNIDYVFKYFNPCNVIHFDSLNNKGIFFMIHICQKVKHYLNIKSDKKSPALDSKSNPLSLLIIIR